MNVDFILLVFFTLFVFYTGLKIVKKNILHGLLYFFLFIYSVFAQIGYCYFPELSVFINAYFGKEVFYEFYFFNLLSFVTFYLCFQWLYPISRRLKRYDLVHHNTLVLKLFFLTLMLCYFSFLLFYFFRYHEVINYSNSSDPAFLESQGFFYKLFALCFKFLVPVSLLFYAQWRFKLNSPVISYLTRPSLGLLFAFSLILFTVLALALGSRTDLLALIIGILVFEYNYGINTKKILFFTGIVFLFLVLMLYVEQSRQITKPENDPEFGMAQSFLLKDYYAPAHMLYTIIGLNVIDPGFVLYSNFANSFFGLNVDYLQIPVTELISPGIANRSQGYAFYLFSEGYMFMGKVGFIYNGFMLFLGLSVWQLFCNSRNHYFNKIIICLLSSQVANLARGQSSYFYKDLIIYLLPLLFLIYFSSGLRFRIKH